MWFFPLPKTQTISFSPLNLVLNNLWEGASTLSFEDYSNLNDLTCPFLSFIPSHLFLPSCSTLSCSSACLVKRRIRVLTFGPLRGRKIQEKIKTQVPGCCQKCCSRKDLILSLCAVPPLLSFPSASLISWLPVIPHCSLPRAVSPQQWRSDFFLGSWLPPACQLSNFPLGITWPSSVYFSSFNIMFSPSFISPTPQSLCCFPSKPP